MNENERTVEMIKHDTKRNGEGKYENMIQRRTTESEGELT